MNWEDEGYLLSKRKFRENGRRQVFDLSETVRILSSHSDGAELF